MENNVDINKPPKEAYHEPLLIEHDSLLDLTGQDTYGKKAEGEKLV